MRVLAIDPGNEKSAFVLWKNGEIVEAEIHRNWMVKESIKLGCYEVIAIEMIASYGMAVGKTVFETCLWIGRFVERATVEPRLVYRSEVKMHHCHNMRAKDSNIRQELINKYGPPGTKKNPGLTYPLRKDLWSAFAIATFITETA